MDELYKIAEEDLDASQLPPGHPDKKNVDASMRLILNDRDTGKFEILKLLHTIPRPILKSMVLNTIGHEYAVDLNDCRRIFYKVNPTAGVYLNSIVRSENKGTFLTGKEMGEVVDLMEK
jgi:hypothetical protein